MLWKNQEDSNPIHPPLKEIYLKLMINLSFDVSLQNIFLWFLKFAKQQKKKNQHIKSEIKNKIIFYHI